MSNAVGDSSSSSYSGAARGKCPPLQCQRGLVHKSHKGVLETPAPFRDEMQLVNIPVPASQDNTGSKPSKTDFIAGAQEAALL